MVNENTPKTGDVMLRLFCRDFVAQSLTRAPYETNPQILLKPVIAPVEKTRIYDLRGNAWFESEPPKAEYKG